MVSLSETIDDFVMKWDGKDEVFFLSIDHIL